MPTVVLIFLGQDHSPGGSSRLADHIAVENLRGDEHDLSWVRDLAGIGCSQDGRSVADRVDETLAETGFGTRR
jgi:hypothetical protein